MQNLRSFCEITEGPSKDLKMDFTSSIFVFLPRFWTTIFWPAVLEIIRTQNRNFECVRRETKKKKKKKKKKKLDGTRVVLGCEMRCEAVGSWVVIVNFLFIFDSDVHIQIFVVTRTLSVYANMLFRKTTDWRFNYLSESFII